MSLISQLSRDASFGLPPAHHLKKAAERLGIWSSPHPPRTNAHYSGYTSGKAHLTLWAADASRNLRAQQSSLPSNHSIGFVRLQPPNDRQGLTGPEYAIHGSSEMKPEAITDSAELPSSIGPTRLFLCHRISCATNFQPTFAGFVRYRSRSRRRRSNYRDGALLAKLGPRRGRKVCMYL